jgi:hypothetical protein
LQLWYWHHSELTTDEAVASSKALIERAAKCGYTGVAFWDNGFGYLSASFWPEVNVRRMHDVMQYAARKGLRVMGAGAPFGWSNAALIADGNMAEAQRVIGAKFKVDPTGKRLSVINSLPPLRNAGFEEGRSGWFDTGDTAIGINQAAHSGKYAAVVVDSPGNARFRQRITLTPWRQYHLSLWFRSSNFRGPAAVEVMDWWHRKQGRFYAAIPADGSHDWKRLDYTFDSQNSNWAYLYFGVWGQSTGTLWFDDISLEETGPVYVARRAGAPLSIYDPEDRRVIYREGVDFNYIFDPALSPPRAIFRDVYHTPVRVSLPPGTRLRPGQIAALDFYAVYPIPGDQQVSMCLTDPSVFRWMEENTRALRRVMPAESPLLLSYDEIRQMNSCASCRGMHMTAGQLLAWNVEKTVRLYEAAMPGSPLYAWSDMFDPYHNATAHYFYVEGDLAGSWKGLPSRVGVLNWDHTHIRESLRWFAGLDARQPTAHRQIVASYYDSGTGNSAKGDLEAASGVPGLDGLMYVTWRDDYSQLERFAEEARKAWSSYEASLASKNSR